jgi:hypothetical protein
VLQLTVAEDGDLRDDVFVRRSLQVDPVFGSHRTNGVLTRLRRGPERGCAIADDRTLDCEVNRIEYTCDMDDQVEDPPAHEIARTLELIRRELQHALGQASLFCVEHDQAVAGSGGSGGTRRVEIVPRLGMPATDDTASRCSARTKSMSDSNAARRP